MFCVGLVGTCSEHESIERVNRLVVGGEGLRDMRKC